MKIPLRDIFSMFNSYSYIDRHHFDNPVYSYHPMNSNNGIDTNNGQLNNMSPINNFAALSAKNVQMKQNWGKYVDDDIDDTSSRGIFHKVAILNY